MAEEYVVISGEIVVVVVVVIIGVFVEIIDDDDDIENSEHNCERAKHILSEYNHVHIDSCLYNHTEKCSFKIIRVPYVNLPTIRPLFIQKNKISLHQRHYYPSLNRDEFEKLNEDLSYSAIST
ncbi:hypothetical protein RhiirA5_496617 [Rhizophagus irregularis]|uniref:Uncharacterized protein n=1 Tax=Rhizophagus irregularis TaxID=588596 RepID=A0A2N0Q1E1_9GLOM|nr:hypothetical protein RhiirA5_496617 [Rhizophagus irregularis]